MLSLFESVLIPDLPFLPAGAKPGLSNIVTMFSAFFVSPLCAVYITAIKVLFAFITRGATAALMSFFGGFLSTAALCFLIKLEGKNLSFIGIGVLCAFFHNAGQLSAACLISGTFLLLNYGKYLVIFALISGFLTGIILNLLKAKSEKIFKAFIF